MCRSPDAHAPVGGREVRGRTVDQFVIRSPPGRRGRRTCRGTTPTVAGRSEHGPTRRRTGGPPGPPGVDGHRSRLARSQVVGGHGDRVRTDRWRPPGRGRRWPAGSRRWRCRRCPSRVDLSVPGPGPAGVTAVAAANGPAVTGAFRLARWVRCYPATDPGVHRAGFSRPRGPSARHRPTGPPEPRPPGSGRAGAPTPAFSMRAVMPGLRASALIISMKVAVALPTSKKSRCQLHW